MTVTQRDIDLWRIEAQEKIRKMYQDWRKDYLGRRYQRPAPQKNNVAAPRY